MMEAVRTSETSVDNHFTRQYNPEESLMMEAVRTSETSVDNHFTRQYNTEDSSEHHTRRRENLKSHN
jgi:predicted amidophosphoribosyltransferase